jgi:hypothetical protein
MITIEKWAGLITAASPYALPGGACVEQNNLQCLQPGQVQPRKGYTVTSATTLPGKVTSAVRYSSGSTDKMVILSGNTLYIYTP